MTEHDEPNLAPNPFLYLTTRGHRSGRPHEIEIWYVRHAGRYYLVSEHRERSHWVQNLTHDPNVTFRAGGASFVGTARTVDAEAEPELTAAVSALMDAAYNWSDGLIVELTPVQTIDHAP